MFINKLGLSLQVFPIAVCFTPIFHIHSQLVLPKCLTLGQEIHILVLHLLYKLYGHVAVIADTPSSIVVPQATHLPFHLLLVV